MVGDRAAVRLQPGRRDAPPWLPQPAAWAAFTAAAQQDDPDSMLSLYRAALRIRREQAALGDGTLRWLDTPDGVLGFVRDPGFGALVNFSERGRRVLLRARRGAASRPVLVRRSADRPPTGRLSLPHYRRPAVFGIG